MARVFRWKADWLDAAGLGQDPPDGWQPKSGHYRIPGVTT